MCQRDSSAVNQNEYGKYGIVKEEHFFHKQRCVVISLMRLIVIEWDEIIRLRDKFREFEVYMSEVKNIPDIMGQGKREVNGLYYISYKQL